MPKQRTLYVGRQVGKLTVVADIDTPSHDVRRVLCRCECGTTVERVWNGLNTAGRVASCGCWLAVHRKSGKAGRTHGLRNTPEYECWGSLIQRCTNPNNPGYHKYGGRGITVCKEWRESFAAFFSDMGPRPTPDHSIERKNNSRGYCPDNCVWAVDATQHRNTRRNRFVTIRGVKMTLTEAAKRSGQTTHNFWARLNRGWSATKAFETPVRHR